MKKMLFIGYTAIFLIVSSCSILGSTTDEKTDSKPTGTSADQNFYPTDKAGEYIFRFNKISRIGSYGKSLWYPLYTNSERAKEWSLSTSKESGHRESGYGMILRYGKGEAGESMLVVLLRTDGYYQVGKFQGLSGGGSSYHSLTEWSASESLNQGYKTWNLIHVRQNAAGKYELYLNGQLVRTFADKIQPYSRGNQHGGIVVLSPHEKSMVEVRFRLK